MAVMNFVLRGLRDKYLTVLMQMEVWWLIFCKCENLFKSNGLNFPLFPVRERNCVKIKNKDKFSTITFHLFNFGKGKSLSQQPCLPLRVET